MIKNNQISLPTIIYLIRHGETDWNVLGKLQGRVDVELNASGRKQANEVASYFETEPWDVVISSPLKRAYETARFIAGNKSVHDILVVNELVERSYGEAEGLLPEERLLQFPDGIVPGQEDFEHLRERALAALNQIAIDFEGKKILVVSHGGIIYTILFSLLGAEFKNSKTMLKNGSINKLIVENNKWTVEFYNKTSNELIPAMKDPKKLYSEADIQTMRLANESRLPGRNRIEEIMNYAHNSGIKRIGIANCIGLQKEAEKLKKRLAERFDVYSIDCKTGEIPSSILLDNDSKGMSCNPAGQAEYLSENKTELNISVGLCMGHDIMFNQKSTAPVTTLIVKDREHKHNPYKEFEE